MANKTYEMVVSLNKSEFDSLNKFKPSYKRGTEEGSYTWCKRQVGYAFCGGKENYTKAKNLYEKGCVLYGVKYGHLLNDANFPSDKPTEEKPTSTSRGKGKKSDGGIDIANLTAEQKKALIAQLLGI